MSNNEKTRMLKVEMDDDGHLMIPATKDEIEPINPTFLKDMEERLARLAKTYSSEVVRQVYLNGFSKHLQDNEGKSREDALILARQRIDHITGTKFGEHPSKEIQFSLSSTGVTEALQIALKLNVSPVLIARAMMFGVLEFVFEMDRVAKSRELSEFLTEEMTAAIKNSTVEGGVDTFSEPRQKQSELLDAMREAGPRH